MLYDQIGNGIKRLRQEHGMTQNDLADILNVSHQMISKYENGWVAPDIAMLIKICDVFHVSLDSLCGLDESSKEAFIRRLSEKYSEKPHGTFSELTERYESFLVEAETVMYDDRIMKIQLSLLENLHDNIENEKQHIEISEKTFECASRILEISRDDNVRSYANYRMAVYYWETPFDSSDFSKNLKLSKAYSDKILLCTYFPEYTPLIGTDFKSEEYTNTLKSNIHFFIKKLYSMIDHMNKRGEISEKSSKYMTLLDLLGELA